MEEGKEREGSRIVGFDMGRQVMEQPAAAVAVAVAPALEDRTSLAAEADPAMMAAEDLAYVVRNDIEVRRTVGCTGSLLWSPSARSRNARHRGIEATTAYSYFSSQLIS